MDHSSSSRRLINFVFSLYLITASDIVPVLVPQTIFSLVSAVSEKFIGSTVAPSVSALAQRLPQTVAWIWLQLLVLDLANQRLPESIAEDTINKPWRPIPSKRMTAEEAHGLLIISISFTFLASVYLGAATESMFLFTLNWLYNDLGLANRTWWSRNLMNALGITTIGAGATRLARGPNEMFDQTATHTWWLLCAAVIATTIHGQDLYDQEGDATRGRSTAPLVLGDHVTRWSLSFAVMVWSVVMPTYLGFSMSVYWIGYMAPILMGLYVGARLLLLRNAAEDRFTFKAWALWTIILYSLPLFCT